MLLWMVCINDFPRPRQGLFLYTSGYTSLKHQRPPQTVLCLTSFLTRMVVTIRVLLARESVTLLFLSRLVSVRFIPLYEFHTAIWNPPPQQKREKKGQELLDSQPHLEQIHTLGTTGVNTGEHSSICQQYIIYSPNHRLKSTFFVWPNTKCWLQSLNLTGDLKSAPTCCIVIAVFAFIKKKNEEAQGLKDLCSSSPIQHPEPHHFASNDSGHRAENFILRPAKMKKKR